MNELAICGCMAAISAKVQISAVADIWKWHVVRIFLGWKTHIVRNAKAQPLSHYWAKTGKFETRVQWVREGGRLAHQTAIGL